VWLGIATITLVIITLVMGGAIHKGSSRFTIKQHRVLAIIALLVALVHGFVGLMMYLS